MDGQTAIQKNSLMIPAGLPAAGIDHDLATECRHLITALSRKVEILCHECSGDPGRVTHMRSLTASLTTLNSLLKTLEQERVHQPDRDFFEDARGFTYRSVRLCDLERISNK